jgi:hypothetical protein
MPKAPPYVFGGKLLRPNTEHEGKERSLDTMTTTKPTISLRSPITLLLTLIVLCSQTHEFWNLLDFGSLLFLVDHTLATYKMYLPHRFAPAIATITLLIALSVLAVISAGEGFRAIVFRGGWLKSTGMKWKRDDAGTLFVSFPWR